jgi:hypothetical protein
MTKTKTNTVAPDWFDGVIYDEGAEVTNQFSGEKCKLNKLELSIYDYTMGCQMISNWDGLRKGLDWFRSNNAKAYLILLD